MADALVVKDTIVGRRGADDQYVTAGYICGEALKPGPVFMHSDGRIYMANRLAHVEATSGAALYIGFVVKSTKIYEPVEIFYGGTEIHYAAGTMTVGKNVYVADTDSEITQDEIVLDVLVDVGPPVVTAPLRVSNPIGYAKTASEIVLY